MSELLKKREREEAWSDASDGRMPDRDGNEALDGRSDEYVPDDPYERTYRDGSVRHECAPEDL